jgi:hypothetical protein
MYRQSAVTPRVLIVRIATLSPVTITDKPLPDPLATLT